MSGRKDKLRLWKIGANLTHHLETETWLSLMQKSLLSKSEILRKLSLPKKYIDKTVKIMNALCLIRFKSVLPKAEANESGRSQALGSKNEWKHFLSVQR